MRDADSAMTNSDWTAYGEAQNRLHDALKRAEEAQRALDGGTGATPAPTSSAAPTPTPSTDAQSGS